MGLIIYSKGGPNVRGGTTFKYLGEFSGGGIVHSRTITEVLKTPEVAAALGVGQHELIVGFATPPGAPASDGPMRWLTRERIVVEPAEAPVRTIRVEALI